MIWACCFGKNPSFPLYQRYKITKNDLRNLSFTVRLDFETKCLPSASRHILGCMSVLFVIC